MAKPRMPLDGTVGKDYRVTSSFGWRVHPVQKIKKHHNGTDLWGPAEPLLIKSWHDGIVLAAGTSRLKLPDGRVGGVGWYVDVLSSVNGKDYVSRYAHMVPNSLEVGVGQQVEAGTVLGKMGTSGESTGKHLHFEICSGKAHRWTADGSGFVDPLSFVKATMTASGVTSTKPPLVSLLRRGSSGDAVRYVQSVLGLRADGKFGPMTEKAVRKFQKKNSLKIDGMVGKATYGRM
jgi:murein DD-endopeptidase MepM/ murein hydrolase activator NlpD